MRLRCVRLARRARWGTRWRPDSNSFSLDLPPLPWKQRRSANYYHLNRKVDTLSNNWFNRITKSTFLPPLPQISKTLKATLTALLDSMCDSDCNPSPDVPSSLSHEPPGVGSAAPKLTLAKRRANQQETETYYFTVSKCWGLISWKKNQLYIKTTIDQLEPSISEMMCMIKLLEFHTL